MIRFRSEHEIDRVETQEAAAENRHTTRRCSLNGGTSALNWLVRSCEGGR